MAEKTVITIASAWSSNAIPTATLIGSIIQCWGCHIRSIRPLPPLLLMEITSVLWSEVCLANLNTANKLFSVLLYQGSSGSYWPIQIISPVYRVRDAVEQKAAKVLTL